MILQQFHPNVRLRIAMNFLTNIVGNMVTPFMSVYFAKTLGSTIAGTAAMLSIAVGLVCATVGGHYADRIGRKKMMLLAETICAVAYIAMALVNSPWLHSAGTTLVMTMLVSVGWGLSRPAGEAMLIDVSTPETRKAIYRVQYWSNNLSISVAGMVGAYFFSDYLFELFLIVGAMSVVAVVVYGCFLAETMPTGAAERSARSTPSKPKGSLLATYKEVLRDRPFMAYVLAGVLTVSVEMNLPNYIGIRMAQHMQDAAWLPGLDAHVGGLQMLGFLRTENTLGVVILSLFVAKWVKGKSDFTTMLGAMALNILGYTYLVFGNQPMLLVALMLIATIGELVYVPLKQAYLVRLVPDHARSSYMAINSMTNRAAQMLAGLNVVIGGFLSPGGMAVLIAVTGFAGLLLLGSVLSGVEARSGLKQSTPL